MNHLFLVNETLNYIETRNQYQLFLSLLLTYLPSSRLFLIACLLTFQSLPSLKKKSRRGYVGWKFGSRRTRMVNVHALSSTVYSSFCLKDLKYPTKNLLISSVFLAPGGCSLSSCATCGTLWTCTFLPPRSCISAASAWTATTPSSNHSSTRST